MSYYLKEMYVYGTTFYDYYNYFLFQRLTGKNRPLILEIGCSRGNFLSIDKDKILGIDIDKEALMVCRKNRLKAVFMDISNGIKFKDNSFDGLFASHILEHLSPEKTLFHFKEIWRVLRPNGVALIYVPNLREEKWHFYWDPTHINPFIKEKAFRAAYEAGFKKSKIKVNYQWKYFPGSTQLHKKFGERYLKLILMINSIWPRSHGNLMIVLKK